MKFRLEHVALESSSTSDRLNASTIHPTPLTQYHVAAEQHESEIDDDDDDDDDDDNDSDRISLNCEDGSLSSLSTGEHYAMEDIVNCSKRTLCQNSSNTMNKINFDENIEKMLIEENYQQQQERNKETMGIIDFSLKMNEVNKNLLNRSRSINATNKIRTLKRKYQNGTIDNNTGTISMPTRIFHADAFCGICQKVKNKTKKYQ